MCEYEDLFCADVNECSFDNGGCMCDRELGTSDCLSSCANTIGSFQCNCNGGYQLDDTSLVCIGQFYSFCQTTVEFPIEDPPRKGQLTNKWCTSGPLSHSSSSFLTPEKRTTSQWRTNNSNKVPL